jgi:polar amino acid transport system permease protein
MMMDEFSTWDIARNLIVAGQWTVILAITAFVLGGTVGLIVLFARIARRPWIARAAKAWISVFQGTPLLLQLFIVFFGLALAGIEVPPWLAAATALTCFTSAFLAEIWRGCVEAIPRGQWEASASLAMTWFEQMRHVILPQALRIAIPPTVGFAVQVVKATAVTSIIGFTELTKTGGMLANATFEPFLVYGFVACGYFILCYPLSAYARTLERKFDVAGTH